MACMVPGQQGECAKSTLSCTNGELLCKQTVQGKVEVCDGLDNDCDGVADNGDPGAGQGCVTGKQGVCAIGATACMAGKIACNPTATPSAETCNGKDDDCNGMVDEGATICQATCKQPAGFVFPNTASVACMSSACVVTCSPGYTNPDGDPCNGCESTTCNDLPAAGTTCAAPSPKLTLAAPFTGQLISAGDSAYFGITFSAPVGFSQKKPSIKLQGADYRMDIITNCASAAPVACPGGTAGVVGPADGMLPESATAAGITSWSVDWTSAAQAACAGANNCTNVDAAVMGPIVVRVTRTKLTGSPCDQFVLAATE
jgi:hypothetical protein